MTRSGEMRSARPLRDSATDPGDERGSGMTADLTLLYRGPLSSCDYDCAYCPFAKRRESAEELAVDRAALERFVDRMSHLADRTLAVFFTPWGEALVRRWYRDAIVRLAAQPHVVRVAVQTNLSHPPDWIDEATAAKLGLWCTYHPSQVARDRFLERCGLLRGRGVRHSVGMVALPEHFDAIESLRRDLPDDTYLWLNAWDVGDGVRHAYRDDDVRRLVAVDPLFPVNLVPHASRDRACRTGSSVLSVGGDGTVRRCHFVREPLGNLHADDLSALLAERPCPKATCDCHIGYVHLDHLRLDAVFGDGILERVPSEPIWRMSASNAPPVAVAE